MSFFPASKLIAKAAIALLLILINTLGQGAAHAKDISKPRVIEFYASWCEPCRRLQPAMDRARAEFGTEVEFVSVNVDDPNSRDVVEQYGVCPIPTLIFEDANQNVKGYAIGCTEDRNIQSGINKIL